MTGIINALSAFTNWAWGLPILILLIAGGIIISVMIGAVQFRRLGFIFKNTLGTLFSKDAKKQNDGSGVTPAQALFAALGGTVGTGNIVGVGTAIAAGGPGALFWMWVCGFIAMGIKYGEVTMSIRYRERDEEGNWRGGPFMYMKEGLHNLPWACAFGFMMVLTMALICCVHSSAITSNLSSVGVSKYISLIIMLAFLIAVLLGGMKTLVSITDKLVPFMSIFYVVVALIVILANIGNIGTVFVSVFSGAFTGTAAVGGFAGAALSSVMRNGLARGVFSNDAGLGLSASIQSQAEGIDHPAQQGMWAVVEVFIDTILLCTLTGLMILFTGVWTSGESGATLSSAAIGSVIGSIGRYGCVIALVLFGLSSLLAAIQGCRIQAETMFNALVGKIMAGVVILLVVLGNFIDISAAFMLADFGNAVILILNIPALILLSKELRSLTKEWFDNDGDLEKIRVQREAAGKE